MTYAQQLLAEGEAKGRAEGEVPEASRNGRGIFEGRGDMGRHQGRYRADRSQLPGAQGTTVRLCSLTHLPSPEFEQTTVADVFHTGKGKTCRRPYLTICIVTG